jgi:hypothetical protein
MLGVGGSDEATAPMQTAGNAAPVQMAWNAQMQMPGSPPMQMPGNAPTSAADRLMQLMAAKQPMMPPAHGPGVHHGSAPSGFSFTYVEKGNEHFAAEPQISRPAPQVFPMTSAPHPMHPLPQAAGFDEFPPLGATTGNDFPALGSPREPKETSKNKGTQEDFMVPSVVAGKARR